MFGLVLAAWWREVGIGDETKEWPPTIRHAAGRTDVIAIEEIRISIDSLRTTSYVWFRFAPALLRRIAVRVYGGSFCVCIESENPGQEDSVRPDSRE